MKLLKHIQVVQLIHDLYTQHIKQINYKYTKKTTENSSQVEFFKYFFYLQYVCTSSFLIIYSETVMNLDLDIINLPVRPKQKFLLLAHSAFNDRLNIE